MNTQPPQRLSMEAINSFREIYAEQFAEVLTDDEAQEIGLRLLRFFAILTKEDPKEDELTEDEFKAMKHIHQCLIHDNKQPTVRGIAEAMEMSSSRSGFTMLEYLLKNRGVWRNNDGSICMPGGYCEVWEC